MTIKYKKQQKDVKKIEKLQNEITELNKKNAKFDDLQKSKQKWHFFYVHKFSSRFLVLPTVFQNQK